MNEDKIDFLISSLNDLKDGSFVLFYEQEKVDELFNLIENSIDKLSDLVVQCYNY